MADKYAARWGPKGFLATSDVIISLEVLTTAHSLKSEYHVDNTDRSRQRAMHGKSDNKNENKIFIGNRKRSEESNATMVRLAWHDLSNVHRRATIRTTAPAINASRLGQFSLCQQWTHYWSGCSGHARRLCWRTNGNQRENICGMARKR